MTRSASNQNAGPPTCTRRDCRHDADLWVYHPGDRGWRQLCEHHVLQLHPSIEVGAWLESGYARPVELGRPNGPPAIPRDGRPAAFREIVDRAMDWR